MTLLQCTATIVRGEPRVIEIEFLGGHAIRRPQLEVGELVVVLPHEEKADGP